MEYHEIINNDYVEKIYHQIYSKKSEIFNDEIYQLIDNSPYFSKFVRKTYKDYDKYKQDALILSLIISSYIIATY